MRLQSVLARVGLAAMVSVSAMGLPVHSAQAETVRIAMLAPSALLWLHAIAEKEGFYAEA